MLEEAGHWRWALRVYSLVPLLLCYLLSANGEAVTSQLSAPAVSVEVEGRNQGYRSTAQGVPVLLRVQQRTECSEMTSLKIQKR